MERPATVNTVNQSLAPEHLATNQGVVGSNPAGRAIRIKQLEPLPAALSIFAARLLRDFSEASAVPSETGAQFSGENSALLREDRGRNCFLFGAGTDGMGFPGHGPTSGLGLIYPEDPAVSAWSCTSPGTLCSYLILTSGIAF